MYTYIYMCIYIYICIQREKERDRERERDRVGDGGGQVVKGSKFEWERGSMIGRGALGQTYVRDVT